MTPETAFDLKIVLSGAFVWISAVLWNRWYTRRLLIKYFVKELHREEALRKLNAL